MRRCKRGDGSTFREGMRACLKIGEQMDEPLEPVHVSVRNNLRAGTHKPVTREVQQRPRPSRPTQ